MSISKHEAAVISAYTGVFMCKDFSDLHEYVEKVMQRPVWTHEMGDRAIAAAIKERAKPDFLKVCASVGDDSLLAAAISVCETLEDRLTGDGDGWIADSATTLRDAITRAGGTVRVPGRVA